MYRKKHTKPKYISNNRERGSVSNPGATVTLLLPLRLHYVSTLQSEIPVFEQLPRTSCWVHDWQRTTSHTGP